MDKALAIRRSPLRWPTFLLAMLAAAAALWIGNTVGEATLKERLAAVVALLFPLVAVVTGRLKQLLLIGWVASLTYNRQYFSFEALTGNLGTQGPYWIVSDIFLTGLLLHWAYEAVVLKKPAPARGAAFWPWYMPLAAMGVVSLGVATRPDWALYEMIRTVKICAILCYVRRQFGKEEWWTAVVAMGATMVGQSLIGLKEVITGKSGLLGTELSTSVGGYENVFSQENFYGWIRATGTMNHPPNLACYLILLIPVFLALALTLRSPRLRLGAALFCVLGCAGLVCTMSRWPGVLALTEMALTLAALIALKETDVRHALGLTFLAIFVLTLALFPIRDKVMDRITRDFRASVDQREEGNRVAFEMIQESPWLGVGLNNSKDHMLKYIPDLAWAFENEDYLTRVMHSRSIAAMGNGFLFVAVELGLVGVIAYAIYLSGTFLMALRSIALTRREVRGVCVGLTLGMGGILLEQLVDFSVWVDPLLYTTVLVAGLVTLAPTLFGDTVSKTSTSPATMEGPAV
jgi:O-antigen ligase